MMDRLRMLSIVVVSWSLVACEEAPAPEAEEAAPAPAPAPVPTPPAEPPGPPPIATVDKFVGAVTLQRGESKPEVKAGDAVHKGDRLQTGKDGKVRLALTDGSILALGPDSQLSIGEFDTGTGRKGSFEITVGKFWANLVKWQKDGESHVEFKTPNAVAGVRGTTLWGDVKVDAICALEGTIEVVSTKAKGKKPPKPMTVKQGTCASKMSKGQTKPLKPNAKQVAKYLAEVLIPEAP